MFLKFSCKFIHMKFIKLNRRHLEEINKIDIESEHQGDIENNL